jgi:predicted ATP-grasp superfamily ATP-dependent carboligase
LPQLEFGASSASIINDLCERFGVSWILPSDADTTRFLAEYRHELIAASYPVPDKDTFDTLNNKHAFASLCQKLGVPVPRSRLLSSVDDLILHLRDESLKPPLVIKPLDMWGGHGVKLFKKGDPLSALEAIDYQPVLAQQYIDGEDLCAFYFCRNGHAKNEVIYRPALRSIEYLEDDAVRRECRKIIKATQFDGVIGFDIRKSSSGNLYFLECNPRLWYNMELVMLAGLNFVKFGIVNADADLAFNAPLAGKRTIRPAGLLSASPSWFASIADRSAVLRYLAADARVTLLIGWHKILRILGIEPGQERFR